MRKLGICFQPVLHNVVIIFSLLVGISVDLDCLSPIYDIFTSLFVFN